MMASVSSAWADSRRRLRERNRARTHSPRCGFVVMRYPPATRCTITPRSSGSHDPATVSSAATRVSRSDPGNKSTRSSIIKGSSAANTRASTMARNLPPCGGAGVSGMDGPGERRRRLVRQDDEDVFELVAHGRPHQVQTDELEKRAERQDAGDTSLEPAGR